VVLADENENTGPDDAPEGAGDPNTKPVDGKDGLDPNVEGNMGDGDCWVLELNKLLEAIGGKEGILAGVEEPAAAQEKPACEPKILLTEVASPNGEETEFSVEKEFDPNVGAEEKELP